MSHVIERDRENGERRLGYCMEWLATTKPKAVDVVLERKVLAAGAEWIYRESKRRKILDVQTGKPIERKVPFCDEYNVHYRVQPSGTQNWYEEFRHHPVADRDYHYDDKEGFEGEVHHQVGLILERVRQTCPEATMTLRLPDEDKPREVDEALIAELKAEGEGPVAVLRVGV